MNRKETAALLRKFNQWRKGEIDQWEAGSHTGPHPREISEAIDAACQMLEQEPAAQPVAVPDSEEREAIAACLEDDAAILRDVDGWEEIPANMDKAAALIRALATRPSAHAQDVVRDAAVERTARLAEKVAGKETADTIRGAVMRGDACPHCQRY